MEPIPSFHDGHLTGVHLGDREAELRLARLGGETWRIVIRGLRLLSVDDLREGNIISHLEIVKGSAPSRAALTRLSPPPHPSAAAQHHERHARLVDEMARAVEAGEAVLVHITPSYGAELFALGDAVEATRFPPKPEVP